MATAATALAGEGSREGRRDLGPLFVATIFVGSFLLFLVQPMVARMALPRLGGAPAVWNSAMLVYQALLLCGYAYAHALAPLPPRAQSGIHLMLVAIAALWLPIGLIAGEPSSGAVPALWVPRLLLLSIGPLFLAVAAQAPLIQRWYASATGGRDPYALYAASNLGSFAGLVSYPLLVEPRLALGDQSALWTAGYAILGLLTLGCALVLPRAGVDRIATRAVLVPAPPLRTRLRWVMLAFVPSGLMLSTTTYLTIDIVAAPLLWVVPLGIYLLSFSVAFAERQDVARAVARVSPLAILVLGGLSIQPSAGHPLLTAAIGLLLLFVVGVTMHGEMYRSRPEPERLTGFYLSMAIGGALGGIFAALVAPLLFDWTYEHPLLILAAGLLAPQPVLLPALARLTAGRAGALTTAVALLTAFFAWLALARPWPWLSADSITWGAVAIGILGLISIGRRVPFTIALAGLLLVVGLWSAIRLSAEPGARTRSYFGIYTVRTEGAARTLAHGTTYHGLQLLDPAKATQPTTYYGPGSGIGQAMRALPALEGTAARVGVVGLGTGTLACYARPGQSWTFFEIDPAIVRIARDTGQFSFLSRCAPGVPIRIGDARLSLAAAPPQSLDLLALDAFSSDAIPMHLLTREAFQTYGRVLAPRGLLLVHITNRFLDLEPVIAAAARDGGWTASLYENNPASRWEGRSVWIAMSRDPAVIAKLTGRKAWRPLRERPGFPGWSDDFASVLPLVKAWETK